MFPKLDKPKRPGTKPTQFRLDDSFMSRLDDLVDVFTNESGMKEDRTSVIRRLIADAHRRNVRVSTSGISK